MQDNPDTVKNRHTPAGKSAEGRKLLFWRIAAGVLFLAVIALGLLLFFSRSDVTVQPEAPAEPKATPVQAVSYTAWCYAPVGEPQQLSAQSGEEITLPQGPQIDGYTFLGWTDENGAAVENGRTKLYGDAAFSAVYAIAFRNCAQDAHHAPYLSVDGEAYFRPAGSVSRAQAAKLLYESLDTDLVGSAVFADVDPAADYAAAAATLKELGVLSESRFHPDDPISLGEMFDMLAHFFPKSAKTYSFASVPESDARYGAFCLAMEQGWIDDPSVSPDADLSRATAARIFNRLRGRIPPVKIDYAMVGTIMDVSYSDPLFPDVYYERYGGTRPDPGTFKKAYAAGKVSWYDGKGNLEGSEDLTATLAANPTEPPTEKPKPGETKATEPPEVVYYQVIYRNMDGSQFAAFNVKEGDPLPKPEGNPTMPDDDIYRYEFAGWNLNIEGVDFEHLNVGLDIYPIFNSIPKG